MTAFLLSAMACLTAPLGAAWLDEGQVDRMARDISKLKFPLAYEAALAVLGPKEVQAPLVQRTTHGKGAPGKDTPFVTQILFTDPAAAKGYFTLVVFGEAKAPSDSAERTVQKLQLRFSMPRGPVRAPLICDGGYRQLALVPPLPPELQPKPDKNGIVWSGAVVASTGKKTTAASPAAQPAYRWLDFADAERIVREIQALKFPVTHPAAIALLAPSDAKRALPSNVSSSAPTLDAYTGEPKVPARTELRFTLTDDSSPQGFFQLEMSGDTARRGTPQDDQHYDRLAVAYFQPRGPVTGSWKAAGGYRKFFLLPDTP
jgi:hypothetical protein